MTVNAAYNHESGAKITYGTAEITALEALLGRTDTDFIAGAVEETREVCFDNCGLTASVYGPVERRLAWLACGACEEPCFKRRVNDIAQVIKSLASTHESAVDTAKMIVDETEMPYDSAYKRALQVLPKPLYLRQLATINHSLTRRREVEIEVSSRYL